MDNKGLRFCGQCLDDIVELHKVSAYCKQCMEFMCSASCLKRHANFKLTKNHSFLLGEELKQVFIRLGMAPVEHLTAELTDDPEGTKYMLANLRTEFNVRSKEDREICSIHASIVLKNGRIVVADLKNQNLKLFDTAQRKCVALLHVEKGPRDICLSSAVGNEMYLIENGLKCIHVVSTDDLTLIRDVPTSGESFGICCWKDGIAVSTKLYKHYMGQYAIQLLDYKGRVVKNFIASKYKGLDFNLPWYLYSDTKGQRVIFSDFGNHSVTCIDVDDGVLFVYKDDELIRPVSVAMDADDDIFVVGQRSHNIHHVSKEGDKKGIVYSDKSLEFPGGISYDAENKRFYIQCVGWSDTIQVFDLEPTTASEN